MSSKKLKRKVAEAEARLDEVGIAQQAIQDRTEHLKQLAKALAYPAHQQGKKQAQTELTKINAEIQKLEPEYEANDQKIPELSEQLVGLQNELNAALIDDLILERAQVEVVALEKWLERDDLLQQSQTAQLELEELEQEIQQFNLRIRGMGGHEPGWVPSISDSRRRVESKNRIRDLRESLKAAA